MTDTTKQRMDEALMFALSRRGLENPGDRHEWEIYTRKYDLRQNALDERIDKLRQKYPFLDKVMAEQENIIKTSEEKYKNYTLDELLALELSGLEKAEKAIIYNYFELNTVYLSCEELLELAKKAVGAEFKEHIKEFVRQKQSCLAKKFREEE
jgi:hypothetical protein